MELMIGIIIFHFIIRIILFEQVAFNILNTNSFYLISISVLFFLYFAVKTPYIHYQLYSIIFGTIILNLAVNKQLKNVLEWKFINFLDKISYGTYLYYFIVLVPVLLLVSKINSNSNFLTLAITIGLATVSYFYFENFFFKNKTKYTLINTGNM